MQDNSNPDNEATGNRANYDASRINRSYLSGLKNLAYRDPNDCTSLHVACQVGDDAAIVDFLTKKYPESLDARDKRGRIPLHYAASQGSSDAITAILLERYPKGCLVQDGEGKIPFHYCSMNNLRLVRIMLEACPRSLLSSDNEGTTPFHLFCFHCHRPEGMKLELLEIMARQAPECVFQKDGKGQTPLHLISLRLLSGESRVCHTRIAELLLERDPSSLIARDNETGRTPLHYAIAAQNMPMTNFLVRVIAELQSSILLTQDKDGNTPLHLSCSSRHQLETVESLARLCPDSLRIHNNEGNCPALGALELAYFRTLVNTDPESALVPNPSKHGQNHLHELCERFDSDVSVWDWIKVLVMAVPRILQTVDDQGRNALHIACSGRMTEGLIPFLLHKCPSLARARDNSGQTPLHLACQGERTYSLKVIQGIANRSPLTAKEADSTGRLPLHVLLSSTGKRSRFDPGTFFNAVSCLVLCSPSSVSVCDHSGVTPFAMACINDAPLDVVYLLCVSYPNDIVSSVHCRL